jgi:hypothetical protein
VSWFYKHGKRLAWKVFSDNTKTLEEFGTSSDTDFPSQPKAAEIFIIKMYSPKSKLIYVDSLRAAMHNKVDHNMLPPTSDALHYHLLICLYQDNVASTSNHPKSSTTKSTSVRWKANANGNTVPVLMTREPMPSNCTELLSCNCKIGCNRRCTCKAMKIPCTEACGCA